MSTEVLNVGFVGVGKHAEQSHIEQLAADPNVVLRAFCDVSEERLAEVKDRYERHASTTTEFDDLLANPDIDAIYAVTPDRLHTDNLLSIAAAGKHAFVEKPLADTINDYGDLWFALSKTPEDIVISTCHPRRFDPPFVNTRGLLHDRAALAELFSLPSDTDFGPVTSFSLNLNYSRPSKTGLHTSFASDHMPHEIDTTSYLFGLSGLSHAVSHVNRELEFDIEAEREDGIKLRFRGNRLQDGKQYNEDMHIGFADGVVLSVDAHTGELQLTEDSRLIGSPQRPGVAEGAPMFVTDYDRRFADLNRHFINSAMNRHREPPYLSRQDLLMNTVVGLALQEVDKPVAISTRGLITQL